MQQSSESGRYGATGSASQNNHATMFVGGLGNGTTDEMMKDYFSKFGEVTKVELKYDKETKRLRGFGFVSFAHPESVNSVLSIRNHELNGKVIDPKKAVQYMKQQGNRKVFIGGIDPNMPKEQIKAYFGLYGPVERVEMPAAKVGSKKRAFCFILFENEEHAAHAVGVGRQRIGARECDVKFVTPQTPKVPQVQMYPPNYSDYYSQMYSSGGQSDNQGVNYSSGYYNYDESAMNYAAGAYANAGYGAGTDGYNNNYNGYWQYGLQQQQQDGYNQPQNTYYGSNDENSCSTSMPQGYSQ